MIERLISLQLGRPWRLLAVIALVSAVSLGLATRLRVLTGFENLLPESRPSVQELGRVAARTGGVSTLFVVIEGEDREALRRAGDALVPALRALGPPWVGQAEDDVRDVIAFLEPRAGLFADLGDLEKLRADVDARFEYEVGKEMGTSLDDEAPPPIDAKLVEERLHLGRGQERRFPGGYYQSEDGKTLVVTVRSGVLASDLGKAEEALARVREVVGRVDPASFDRAARWGITGDLAIGVGEYAAINRDLTSVGITGAALIAGVVLLFYLRLRTLLAMVLTIAIGLAWTFGLTEVVLGHLNLATGFLFTIVAGNGINAGIIFMTRYLEERRVGGDVAPAIRAAHARTWKPTLTAAAAAGGSYGSLLVTSFKGFREFGVIGGAGMILCWIATYLALPPILVVMESAWPLGGRSGLAFGRPFAFAASRAPRLITIAGAGLAVVGLVAACLYARENPMEYDLAQVQSDQRAVAEEQRLIRIAKRITGYIGLDGMAILVDRVDQVAPLEAALEARRDAAPEGEKPFKALHALEDFVPKDQAAKIPVLMKMKERLLRVRRLHGVSDADWARIERFLPPDDLRPFGLEDLPPGLARPFTERDGTRGRILYISPTSDELTSDAHYLFRWADSFRRTELPDGSVILGSGRAVIYADMWAAILEDVPRAVVVSFLATFLVVLVAFRFRRAAISVVLALVVGAAWMTGLLAAVHAKLNFLNFMALPITFGIGVDYAVNVVHRDLVERDAIRVLERTGGAVVLSSMTTLLGYLALVRSVNFAVRSLGVAAVIGEATCLMAAVLVLPAALVWWRAKKDAKERAPLRE